MPVFRVENGSSRGMVKIDANDRAPQGRELSVREALTRIIVDWSGSWQAARPGNWLGRSPATKAALGCCAIRWAVTKGSPSRPRKFECGCRPSGHFGKAARVGK